MKKTLSTIALGAALFISQAITAQSTISFEASENYVVGNINNQNNWVTDNENIAVASGFASQGTNALKLTSNGGDDWSFAHYDLTNSDKISISADIFMDSYWTDYGFGIYDADGAPVADFWMSFYSDYFLIYDPIEDNWMESNSDAWDTDTWYNIKIEVDKSAGTLKYFVNNQEVYSTQVAASDVAYLEVATDNYGTGDQYYVDNIYVDNFLGTKNVVKNGAIKLYPNPVVDYATLDVDAKISSVEVFDAAGRSVKTIATDAKKVDLSQLAKGVYTLKVETSKGVYSKKFIKK